ncbi:EamA family transporter RarD [Sphingorhabdus sp.]|uniref:EamA family transporter RarD n=1 Tax=Sphingorhabdus sp. TaxID=1902408 RepID=UPI00359416B9
MTDKSETPPPNGLPFALAAYLIWGFVPVYFKLLGHVPPAEIVAQRILWSIPLLLVIMYFRTQLGEYAAIFRHRAHLRNLIASAILIALNWLIFIWAVSTDHILAASLGYYLTPLVNVLLGRMFLGERLLPMQLVAVAVAALGVAILIGDALDTFWVSVSLACSFGIYGLIRKITPVGSVPGLAVETTLLAPLSLVAVIWFATNGTGGFGDDGATTGLLILSGAVTAIPLLLFATAARRMSYASLGFVQFLSPTIGFLLGVFVYNEPLSSTKLACFILIWIGIAIFCIDALRTYRAGKA